MTRIVTRETDGTLDGLTYSLLNIKDTLRSQYWELSKTVTNNSYPSSHEQTQDLIALGKIAEALQLVSKASGKLRDI